MKSLEIMWNSFVDDRPVLCCFTFFQKQARVRLMTGTAIEQQRLREDKEWLKLELERVRDYDLEIAIY